MDDREIIAGNACGLLFRHLSALGAFLWPKNY